MDLHKCTYRKSKGRGARCTAYCSSFCPDELYCNAHRRLASELQQHIHDALVHSNIETLDKTNWYAFVQSLLARDVPTAIIEESLRYLFSAFDLWELARPVTKLYCTMRKMDVAHCLVTHARNVYTIQQSPKRLQALVNLQKKWREKYTASMQRICGPWPSKSAINDEDPFSLEPLDTFPAFSVFSFQDPDTGSIFAFHAPELECALRQGHHLNPFTRKPIPNEDLSRLHQMMKRLPKKTLPFTPNTWTSPYQVFQDVCAEYQRLFGIYLLPEWLQSLGEDEVEYIFYTYKIRTLSGSPHMRLSFLRRPPCKPWGEYAYVLGHEMWRLSQDFSHPRHMFWMCMLLITIAEVSHDMVLPSWIFDTVM